MEIDIPKHVLDSLARALLPAIIEFYESEDNQKAFQEWYKSKSSQNKSESSQSLPRMRTIHEAAEELRKADPSTAISEYHIRRLTLDGTIPRVKAGKKYLINLDMLIEYLKRPDR